MYSTDLQNVFILTILNTFYLLTHVGLYLIIILFRYRSKVLTVEPLKVKLIDYGITKQINRDNIRQCPETYKDMKPLVS